MLVYVIVNITTGRYLDDFQNMDYTRNPLAAIHFQSEDSATTMARLCYSPTNNDEFAVQMLVITADIYPAKLVAPLTVTGS